MPTKVIKFRRGDGKIVEMKIKTKKTETRKQKIERIKRNSRYLA